MKKLSEQQLKHDLGVLEHGGAEAISLFFEMAAKLFNKGGHEYLDHWITAAAPALPEKDRNSVLAALLGIGGSFSNGLLLFAGSHWWRTHRRRSRSQLTMDF